jgi:hypothetical protein
MEWRTGVMIVLVVSLCFFMIPIEVEPDRDVEDAKLFTSYIERYNKSYRDDPEISKMRFEHFQVNDKAIRPSIVQRSHEIFRVIAKSFYRYI